MHKINVTVIIIFICKGIYFEGLEFYKLVKLHFVYIIYFTGYNFSQFCKFQTRF